MNTAMSIAKRLALILLMILPFAASGNPAETTDLSIRLGFAHGRPAVYFSPREGMKVQLKNIIYNKSDKAIAYDLEVNFPSGKTQVITLKPGTEIDQESPAYCYKAEINGKAKMSFSLQEWEATKPQGLIAFFPEGMGGYVIRFSGSITQTNVQNVFSYDSLGHRSFGEQSFTCEGTTYKFKYSSHQRDDSGNLTGYIAEILTVKKDEPHSMSQK